MFCVKVLILVVVAVSRIASAVPKYTFHQDRQYHREALAKCKVKGLTLAEPKTEEEATALIKLLNEHYAKGDIKRPIDGLAGYDDAEKVIIGGLSGLIFAAGGMVWIGGSGSPGAFTWTDGSSFGSWIGWAPDQPPTRDQLSYGCLSIGRGVSVGIEWKVLNFYCGTSGTGIFEGGTFSTQYVCQGEDDGNGGDDDADDDKPPRSEDPTTEADSNTNTYIAVGVVVVLGLTFIVIGVLMYAKKVKDEQRQAGGRKKSRKSSIGSSSSKKGSKSSKGSQKSKSKSIKSWQSGKSSKSKKSGKKRKSSSSEDSSEGVDSGFTPSRKASSSRP